MFDGAIRTLGWHYPVIDVAMDKLCYIDPDADVNVYLAMMSALEGDFPATVFVHMTMPLQSGQEMDWSNALAMAYNEAVRQHCSGPDRLLLDIADIESHDPAGNPVTFTYDGHVCQRLYGGYTTDGGHLNDLGARRVALGWYAAGAALVSGSAPVPELPETGRAGITSIAPNPVRRDAAIHFRVARSGPAELVVCDVHGRLVASLVNRVLQAGEHRVTWKVIDDSGRAPSEGIYFTRLRADGITTVRRFALVR
jgi:hypothetical protein